jgi:hypothetical protein
MTGEIPMIFRQSSLIKGAACTAEQFKEGISAGKTGFFCILI